MGKGSTQGVFFLLNQGTSAETEINTNIPLTLGALVSDINNSTYVSQLGMLRD